MNRNSIALRIRQIREYRNYTQAFVASKLNLKQNTYSQIENGTIEVNYPRLEKIAAILNFPIEQLMNQDFEIWNSTPNRSNPVSEEKNNVGVVLMIQELKNEMRWLRQQNEALLQAIQSLK
ncbi:MAG: helix-turn-helix domain-containing protein [Taibaiella sp.]|nr:helix-turn-helix domain-containing protein [Taibaiella sp.]